MLLATLALGCVAAEATATSLVPNSVARRHGLVRAWFSQARLNPAKYEVENVVLDHDRLFVLTTSGSVQAFDSETGEMVWQARVGNPGYPSLGPVADDKHVAVVNGGSVYVLERATGQQTLSQRTTSGIAGAPALSENFVFIPQFSGRVDAFGLRNPRPVPWYFTSAGRIFEDASFSPLSIIWATDKGHLYVADPDGQGVRFRFESALPIVAPATTHSEKIFTASMGGYVYALREQSGLQLWRYACGAPVTKSPIALGKTLFVASQEPALHCIDAETGDSKWLVSGVSQFVSASPSRVYGLDRLGNFVVVDREHGVIKTRAGSMGDYRAVLNEQTDRLYLFSSDGLLQCFHEIGLDEPVLHDPKQAETPEELATEEADAEPEPETTEEAKPEPTTPDPFGGGADPFGGGGADPFGGGADPFGAGGGGADPFGGGGADPFGGGDSDEDPFN